MSSPQPPHVLLVDDDAAVLDLVREALTSYGMMVHAHSDGRLALEQLGAPDAPPFDLVISDINMDGFDGFDVIHRVKTLKPHLPVVLMTGAASVEYSIRALRMGAANLFVKPLSLRDMVKSVFHLVDLHREFRLAQVGLKGLAKETREFRFRSEHLDIPALIRHLTDRLEDLGFAQPSNLDTIAMAYHEALVNALDHGSLELDSSLKGDLLDDEDPYQDLRRARLADPAYGGRVITVRTNLDEERYILEIEDQGRGFDARKASPASHSDLVRQCGRGLPLIQAVMDEVGFSERGNCIRMVLSRKS